ncbi:hypothetical protein BEWA_008560 [Theileria equi strain WA]|uniref:Uncharacterized protein n=1 Tax=Theileria equi strain WA TaxID=1537102 RepID=L0B2K8_THEEQ|nr:hypothetical protein BEWA_008560 [Theileria equi strain WA]AFZ81446.1 hypothetical protein BEWA_008560 [Theileria equi strain WA]|eukprot:XP_004831112.1 hypothetical protein BEWA_008560 [Theileria equi strain WA]
MIAMSRSADVPSGKYLNKTLMVLIGNMLGEFGNRLIIIIIDLQSDVITSSDLETSMFMWLFSIIPITIGSILASIHLYFRSLGASINDVYRENIRFSNAKRQYNIAKYALQRCIPMVSLVWVIQAIEGFFNTGAVVCTIDAFPQISNSFECALILIFMAFLDLTGRCIVIFMNLLGYKIERNKSIVSNSESTHKFKTSISYLWVSIAFIRIPSALLLLLGRHYRDVLGTFLEANVIATISTLNRFLRGIIIGLVYYSLYSTAYEESLKFYNLPPKVSINEPLECMDQRVTSANSAVLVIPLVYLIEIVIMLISLYFGFKYQMLIFEAENLDNSTWPTDFTDNHGKKFWYWISNIMYSVFQDIEYPFGLCK